MKAELEKAGREVGSDERGEAMDDAREWEDGGIKGSVILLEPDGP